MGMKGSWIAALKSAEAVQTNIEQAALALRHAARFRANVQHRHAEAVVLISATILTLSRPYNPTLACRALLILFCSGEELARR